METTQCLTKHSGRLLSHFLIVGKVRITIPIFLEENGTTHENKQEVTEILNDYFVNIVEIATGRPPFSQNFTGVSEILDKHKNHPSIIKIKCSQTQREEFTIPLATENDICDILKSLNTPKGTGFDKIPAKLSCLPQI